MPFSVFEWFKKSFHLTNVFIVIKRGCRGVTFFELSTEISCIFCLNMSAVLEHDRGQLCSSFRAENRTTKTGSIKAGQISGMINMSVGENNCIQVDRIAVKSGVCLVGFTPFSLKQTTVKKNPQIICFQKMLTFGSKLCRLIGASSMDRDWENGMGMSI